MNPDKATARELLRLEVYCPNRDNGCYAKLKWSELSKHSAICSYKQVQCPSPGCNEILYASELAQHLESCEFLLEKCGICDTQVSRKDLKSGHETECIAKPRKCALSSLGCQFEGSQDTMKQHLITCIQPHSKQIINALANQRSDQAETRTKITEMQNILSGLEITIGSLKSNSKSQKDIQLMQRSVAKLNDDVNVLKRKVEQFATITQLQESTGQIDDIKQIAISHESRIGHLEQNNSEKGVNRHTIAKIDRIESTVSMHDIRLAESDLRFRLLETAAFEGRLIWRIPNYSRRKRDAIEGRTASLYSQPFYSSYYGYKMCARVYLNGDGLGKGSHMSLFFVLMRGEYDSLLTWPFRQKVTLSLLDQSGNRKHIIDTFRPDPTSSSFRKPVGEMNIASGSPMFATQSQVESAGHLVDDTLFIGVSIDKTDLLNPWM